MKIEPFALSMQTGLGGCSASRDERKRADSWGQVGSGGDEIKKAESSRVAVAVPSRSLEPASVGFGFVRLSFWDESAGE